MFPTDTDFETDITFETERTSVDEELPFRLLLLGDWSGRESRSANSGLEKSQPIELDCDNFDDVIKKLDVKLNLSFQADGETNLSIRFETLDDFHPDQLFQQLPLFSTLKEIRKKLLQTDTFNEAAREVRSWIIEKDVPQEKLEKSINSSGTALPQADLLNQILDETKSEMSDFQIISGENKELSIFIKKLVEPHLIQTDTAEQSKLLIIIDEIISDLMRKILHHPQFQALESAWRGANFIIKNASTSNELKFYLMDCAKAEVIQNLKSVDNLSETALFQTLKAGADGYSDEEPWSAVLGNYNFSLTVDDAASLIRLSKIASVINAPFITHISPEIFGFESFAEPTAFETWQISEDSDAGKLWTALRSNSNAEYLGLLLPRFLIRLPYGEQTDPTENFYFEEFNDSVNHEDFLWVNPAFAFALLLAQTFDKHGWNISRNFSLDIENLPAFLHHEGNEIRQQPCTEILMTQTNCEKALQNGLMPLISFRNSDRIRLGRFQSIAKPSSTVAGNWT